MMQNLDFENQSFGFRISYFVEVSLINLEELQPEGRIFLEQRFSQVGNFQKEKYCLPYLFEKCS